MSLKERLKQLLVEELQLEDLNPADIPDDAPLFGDPQNPDQEGLGLDSLDAVEVVVIVQKHFQVEIKDMQEGQKALQSIDSLARFIEERQGA